VKFLAICVATAAKLALSAAEGAVVLTAAEAAAATPPVDAIFVQGETLDYSLT
jgi:hypothetical protein